MPGLSWEIVRPKLVHVIGRDLDGTEISIEADADRGPPVPARARSPRRDALDRAARRRHPQGGAEDDPGTSAGRGRRTPPAADCRCRDDPASGGDPTPGVSRHPRAGGTAARRTRGRRVRDPARGEPGRHPPGSRGAPAEPREGRGPRPWARRHRRSGRPRRLSMSISGSSWPTVGSSLRRSWIGWPWSTCTSRCCPGGAGRPRSNGRPGRRRAHRRVSHGARRRARHRPGVPARRGRDRSERDT
ncbi:MAG: hypothetical protein R2695_18240 [Acidimicrobiales bacterium]